MAPAKRKARRREPRPQPAANAEASTSSPVRPTHKKRKVKGGRVSAKFQSTSPEPGPEEYNSDTSETSEPNANKELVDSVVSYLAISKETPGVLKQHGNDVSAANNEQKVSAYAKLSGKDWTYFILDQVTYLGRTAEDDERGGPHGIESSPAGSSFTPDIDLGPSKFVSRKHATISYEDSDAESSPDSLGEGWHLRVGGRNGVKVNTTLIKKGGRQRLQSGDVIEVHGTQMMFVLPNEEAVIHPFYIEKAKQAAAGDESLVLGTHQEAPSHAHPEPEDPSAVINSFLSTNGQSGQPPLAPAPPGGKRALTPSHNRMTDMSASQSTPAYNRGVVMETTQNVDYSLDSAKDLKPPFSYATLIAQAIFSDPEEQRSLASIYQWIMDRYAFYRHSTGGWQNSIRHNLSLSKAFEKVPRKTNEPGKGMKWRVHPDARADQLKKLRGKASSSGPNSPAGVNIANPNPNFRGPNGQPLGYDSSYAGQFQLNEPNDPQRTQPQMSMATSPIFSSQQPREAFTPERGGNAQARRSTLSGDGNDDGPAFDESPLPSNRRAQPPPFTLSAQSPPTLSSSYVDTPFHGHSTNLFTPAHQRRNVQLAPPSTLVAPSKFMPESSPAGPGSFPFFMGKLGGTPGGALLPEISPLKKAEDDVNGPHAMSSSPPPVDSGSPSKKGRGTPPSLSQGQSSSATKRETSLAHSVERDGKDPTINDDDEEDDGNGFDLARGFQPIGSFTASRSQSLSQPPPAVGRAGIGSRT